MASYNLVYSLYKLCNSLQLLCLDLKYWMYLTCLTSSMMKLSWLLDLHSPYVQAPAGGSLHTNVWKRLHWAEAERGGGQGFLWRSSRGSEGKAAEICTTGLRFWEALEEGGLSIQIDTWRFVIALCMCLNPTLTADMCKGHMVWNGWIISYFN